MELTIQQADLAFGAARRCFGVHQEPVPLLSCVAARGRHQGLRITGTDLDVTTTVELPLHRQETRRAAVQRGTSTKSCARCPRVT